MIICPCCFEKFNANEVEFRCSNVSCSHQTPDTVYAGFRRISPAPVKGCTFSVVGNRFLAYFNVRLAADCPHCKKETQVRVCPHCHFQLPHDAGVVEDKVIAIIGGRQTGKGHYIASLIHRLQTEIGPNFKFSIWPLGDTTLKRFEEDYHDRIFNKKKVLEFSRAAKIDPTIKEPLQFRLTISNERGQVKSAINLSFFDTAGEDMQSLDNLNVETRYILQASGIIFLLDPLQIPAVRDRLNPSELPPELADANPINIIGRLKPLFEMNGRVSPHSTIKTPLAFVLSKTDALFPILDPSSNLRRNGRHYQRFNEQDFQSVHTEVESLLIDWISPRITNQISSGFGNFRYSGVSSLGQPPKGQDLSAVNPIRVEDPFLWILKQLKMID